MKLLNARRTVAIALSSVAVGGLLTATPSTANAGVWSNCADSYSCFWNYNGWAGTKWQFSGNNANWGTYGRSNQDNSMVNDGNSYAIRLYNGTNYSGINTCVRKGYGIYIYGSGYPANITSSNRWVPSC